MNVFFDQMERKVQLKPSPQRIVSLVPSITEFLFALGLEDRVVGITKFCIFPDEWFRTKTKIGGTKSFASRTYNQQFAGTFKKIRHLFAITPSQGNEPILKFDQILYNDKLNSSVNNSQKNLIIHEELLYDKTLVPLSEQIRSVRPDANKNLLNNSMKIIQDYLTNTNSIKKEYSCIC
jgi:hypothetical protein